MAKRYRYIKYEDEDPSLSQNNQLNQNLMRLQHYLNTPVQDTTSLQETTPVQEITPVQDATTPCPPIPLEQLNKNMQSLNHQIEKLNYKLERLQERWEDRVARAAGAEQGREERVWTDDDGFEGLEDLFECCGRGEGWIEERKVDGDSDGGGVADGKEEEE